MAKFVDNVAVLNIQWLTDSQDSHSRMAVTWAYFLCFSMKRSMQEYFEG